MMKRNTNIVIYDGNLLNELVVNSVESLYVTLVLSNIYLCLHGYIIAPLQAPTYSVIGVDKLS